MHDIVNITAQNGNLAKYLYFKFGRVQHEVFVQNPKLLVASTIEIE
jgi:hypothetical protein